MGTTKYDDIHSSHPLLISPRLSQVHLPTLSSSPPLPATAVLVQQSTKSMQGCPWMHGSFLRSMGNLPVFKFPKRNDPPSLRGHQLAIASKLGLGLFLNACWDFGWLELMWVLGWQLHLLWVGECAGHVVSRRRCYEMTFEEQYKRLTKAHREGTVGHCSHHSIFLAQISTPQQMCQKESPCSSVVRGMERHGGKGYFRSPNQGTKWMLLFFLKNGCTSFFNFQHDVASLF